jgi:hypothetical protein
MARPYAETDVAARSERGTLREAVDHAIALPSKMSTALEKPEA